MNRDADDQARVRYFADISEFFDAARAQEMYSDLMVRLGAGKPEQEFFQQDIDMNPNWH